MIDEDQLRLATALAHCVPGVTLGLRCMDGTELVVASRRLDAHLGPCQLRAAVLVPARPGTARLAEKIAAVEVRLGLQDLGGGLYRRHGANGEERWFATSVAHERLSSMLDRCPVDLPDESMTGAVKPDEELGVTVVCVTANHPSVGSHLDAVASWALGVCMVEELLAACRRQVIR
jgi:hypothetical protein